MMHTGMPWMEGQLQQYGIDITPCHDSDGTWNPGPECFGFPYGPDNAGGSWSDGCNSGELNGYSSMCGAPFNSEPDDTGPAVAIINPPDQSQFDSMGAGSVDISISATADDGDGWGVQRVTLLIDGAEEAPYEWANVTFPTGTYTLEALAEDYAGNTSLSQAHQIGVDESPEPPLPPPSDTGSTGGDGGTDSSGGTAGTGVGEAGTGDGGFFDGGDDGGGEGCACTTSPASGWGPGMLMLGLLGLVRRRRG
jgi:MYXO-CTERM domain-containing protein